ncbi:ATP-binding cassette domain-containing protein [Streptomyces wuyuanensis]|uniref:ABC transporter n=1 Tax=Streptomyces wuyuanensis TaxID=1196353 RepID=A0A1G9QXX6_9ACTN|nr:ATP-binding cassette domain-containing protein [Streptomyces wuyuanensis]SDM15095.1 ABC transporter [Streptomyces wuyuanensis]
MDSPHGAAVRAEGFGLEGPRGWAFRRVDVEAGPGSLVAIEGPSGSGRTCLLLALTGRMKPTDGHAEVGGLRLPRKMAAVRRISALGPVPGVSDLDPALTVAEHLRERALMQRRFDGSLRALLRPPGERAAAARARIEEALASVGLEVDALPKGGRTAVRDLERLEALRLSVALALIGRPRLLAVDDADLKLSEADRAQAWGLLRDIAAEGTTVLMVCSEAPKDAVVVRTGTGASHSAAAGKPGDGAPEGTAPGIEVVPAAKAAGTAGTAGAAEATEAEPVASPAEAATADPDTGTTPATGTEPGTTPDTGTTPATGAEPGTTAEAAGTGTGDPVRGGRTGKTNETEEGAADALAETGRA